MAVQSSSPVGAIAIKLDQSEPGQSPWVLKPLYLGEAVLKRAWWHTKAYGTIAGLMLLVGLSLVVLQAHQLYRQWVASGNTLREEGEALDSEWQHRAH